MNAIYEHNKLKSNAISNERITYEIISIVSLTHQMAHLFFKGNGSFFV